MFTANKDKTMMNYNNSFGETKYTIEDIKKAGRVLDNKHTEEDKKRKKIEQDYANKKYIKKPSIWNFYAKTLTEEEAYECFRYSQYYKRHFHIFICECRDWCMIDDNVKGYLEDMAKFTQIMILYDNSTKVYLSADDSLLIEEYLKESKE